MATEALKAGVKLKSGERTYEIVKVLGSGSFGITYLAKAKVSIGNISTSIFFAIKEHFLSASCYRADDGTNINTVPSARTAVKESMAGFITEANRLKKLCQKSRSIVKVNEVFEANSTAYYVMEYLDGGTPGKCSEEEAVGIILQTAEALKVIHGEKLLHLDIKPDNIVMKIDDRNEIYPVLIDFGIAKHFDSKGRPTTSLNAKGASPGYAPQEQYAGVEEFSPKYDVYALGAVLFFLLTGKNPPDAFKISANQHELKKLLDGKVSENVTRALLHAMQPNAELRTPTVEQFCDELSGTYIEPIIDDKPSRPDDDDPKPSQKPDLRKWLLPGLGILIIGILTAAGILIYKNVTKGTRPLTDDEIRQIIEESNDDPRLELFDGFYLTPVQSSLPVVSLDSARQYFTREEVMEDYLASWGPYELYNKDGEKLDLPGAAAGIDSIALKDNPFLEYIDNGGIRRVVALLDNNFYFYMGDLRPQNGKELHILANVDNKYGVVDGSGRIVKDFIYNKISPTEEGYLIQTDSGVERYDSIGNKLAPELQNKPATQSKTALKIERYPDGKDFFKDADGNVVSSFQTIDFAESNGHYKVKGENGGYGIYNTKTRELVVPTLYEDVSIYGTQTNLFPAKKQGAWGFVRAGGEEVIGFKFLEANSFNAETRLAAVKDKDYSCGYIDTTGNYVIKPQYYSAGPMTNNGAIVINNDKKYGIINKDGKLIISWYPGMGTQFILDRIYVKDKNNRIGFINRQNELVIPYMFESTLEPKFDEISKLAKVRYKGEDWFINTNGAFCYPAAGATNRSVPR